MIIIITTTENPSTCASPLLKRPARFSCIVATSFILLQEHICFLHDILLHHWHGSLHLGSSLWSRWIQVTASTLSSPTLLFVLIHKVTSSTWTSTCPHLNPRGDKSWMKRSPARQTLRPALAASALPVFNLHLQQVAPNGKEQGESWKTDKHLPLP